jgi:phage terminase large subunit GpA-like protein
VLAHCVIWGSPDGDSTWMELDELLRTRWKHPNGGTLKVDAAVFDSGDRTDQVYAFCFPRLGRRIWAGKGVAGSRPALQASGSKVKGGRLFLIGVDTLKSALFDRLARGTGVRFSHTLDAAYFEQVASERKVVRYRGQPVRRFGASLGRRAESTGYAHIRPRAPACR